MTRPTILEDRLVAFIDILGFREIIKGMADEPGKADFIRDVLKIVQKQERKISRERRNEERRIRRHTGRTAWLLPPARLEMTAFSDCYVISSAWERGWDVLVAAQALAALMLYKGILIRGGIVRGKAYHERRVLFGPAVIAAYELQEHAARYPRIVVEDHIVRSEWLLSVMKKEFFLRDSDGCWFLTPFQRSISRLSTLLPELRPEQAESDFHTRVRDHIVQQLSTQLRCRNRNWDHIAKLRWLAARFNDALASELIAGVASIDLDRPRVPVPI